MASFECNLFEFVFWGSIKVIAPQVCVPAYSYFACVYCGCAWMQWQIIIFDLGVLWKCCCILLILFVTLYWQILLCIILIKITHISIFSLLLHWESLKEYSRKRITATGLIGLTGDILIIVFLLLNVYGGQLGFWCVKCSFASAKNKKFCLSFSHI